jgi:hypothetical protein
MAILAALLIVSCEQENGLDANADSGEGASNAEKAQQVLPEAQLNKWGYKTTELTHTNHYIRSLKNYGDSDEAFYARFSLEVLSFDTEAEAAAEKENVDSERDSTVLGRDKDYRRFVRKGKTLYVVSATSNYTRLEHQPALMEQIKAHLESQNP